MSNVQKTPAKSRTNWRDIVALDLRSLALFRIFAGLIILADLLFRLPTLLELYTEQGFMTRSFSADYFSFLIGEDQQFVWSFYWLGGQAWWYYTLFALAAVLACMLTLGYRTRIATIGSWALLVSLHTANPFVITSGDMIFRLSLFWSIFLPLGQVWSLDACRRNRNASEQDSDDSAPAGRTLSSVASACFIVQFMFMYFFSGIAKCNNDWFSGEAMHYVLRLNIYVTPFGIALLKYPLLIKLVAYSTLFAEVILIWCLLIPWKNAMWRGIVMLTFISFHIGIMLTLDIGLFSFICIAIWSALLPSQFWSMFPSRLNADSVRRYVARGNNWVVNLFCVVAILFVTLANLASVARPGFQKLLPKKYTPYGYLLGLDQRFHMFGQPPRHSPWFVYEATLANGKTVNPFQRPLAEPTSDTSELHQLPVNYRTNLPTFHWRKVHRNMVNQNLARFRERLAEYAAQKWNAEHADDSDLQIVHLKLFCYLQSTDRKMAESFGHSSVWATWGEAAPEVIEAKVDNLFDQLLEDDNPDGLPF